MASNRPRQSDRFLTVVDRKLPKLIAATVSPFAAGLFRDERT
jgi:hypothetical protein